MKKEKIKEVDPKMKVSTCQECKGMIRVAISEHLDNNTIARNEFKNEVLEHNLAVEEMTLEEYKAKEFEFCSCDEEEEESAGETKID